LCRQRQHDNQGKNQSKNRAENGPQHHADAMNVPVREQGAIAPKNTGEISA
jgi:hypothetical protein